MLLLILLMMMRVPFSFLLEAEPTSSLYVHINLATDSEAESPCFAQLPVLELLAFKRLLNVLLLER